MQGHEPIRLHAREQKLVKSHGTVNQYERYVVGKLPHEEMLLLARTVLFAPFMSFDRYEKIAPSELKHERNCSGRPARVTFETREPDNLTADEWSKFKAITTAVSQANQDVLASHGVQATVDMVEHVGTCSSCGAEVFERSAAIRMTWAGHQLAREYTLEKTS